MARAVRARVREAEVEDVFALYPAILAQVLGFDGSISLVARQMDLPTGRLDLLVLADARLILVELKAGPFHSEFISQVTGYRRDLTEMQRNGRLVSGEIDAVLLVTECSRTNVEECGKHVVTLVPYSPEQVLANFYARMAGLSNFLTLRPKDYGVWNIHLVNRPLYLLSEGKDVVSIAQNVHISETTVVHLLRFASQLQLVVRRRHTYELTDLGRAYIAARDRVLDVNVMSEAQVRLIRDSIVKDPFASPVSFGIHSLVEGVFTLARNSYPVDLSDLLVHYAQLVGKKHEWATERSAFLGTKAFANFAVELGLLAQVGNKFMLTPAGFRFVLMLQLHKGIRLVDSLQVD